MNMRYHWMSCLVWMISISFIYASVPKELMTTPSEPSSSSSPSADSLRDPQTKKSKEDTISNLFGDSVKPQFKDRLQEKLDALGIDKDALKAAIAEKESNGRYNAKNPHSSAAGKYQFMDGTRRALGFNESTRDFLNSPDRQEAAMDALLESNLNRAVRAYGNDSSKIVASLASMHYSGRPTAWEYSTGTQYYGSGTYPSIARYSRDILSRYNRIVSASNTPIWTQRSLASLVFMTKNLL